ncbi:HipA domain-containing protein [Pseudomonas sp.]|uniref:HipA domain-containing protein n=1 Tax=Pseudomonas sp. TaxID=306 RepID=UPI002C762212|nr:HipA domain-containing protein [Pseudomonas sp.]HUE92329.1 HipA domain-containing protein [Pseudomonas sp.]
MPRVLNIWINSVMVGALREFNGLWAFAYSQEWLNREDAHPLCPGLPLQSEEHVDGASVRPVQWYFDNLLPEEGQRLLIAQSVGRAFEDAFGLLEYFGAESAGSLTLLPPGEVPEAGGLRALSYEELSTRIQDMPRVPLAERSAKKMSLAGAQHKVAVILRDGQILEPTGSTPSTHILKPDHPDVAWAHSVINEWFVMTLAKRLGLNVPQVTRLYVPQPVYLIERFDRLPEQPDWRRLHCIDACQLTGLSREFKYSAGSVSRLNTITKLCVPPVKAREALFKWLVFNVLVGNEDAHLKNLSFLVGRKGVALSPFYDLLCTAVYGTRAFDQDKWPGQAALAWPLNGVANLSAVSRALLVEVGVDMGIKPATANKHIDQLADNAYAQAKALQEEVAQQNEALIQTRPEIRATLNGEMRLLRAMVEIVIREMARQIRRVAD